MSNKPAPSNPDELSLQEAIEQISAALAQSHSPLIVGLENLSTQSQQAAMKLARHAGATIDSSSDNIGRGNMFALQKRGRVSASLGEIKSRSNLVLFWFCDPVADHVDFFERYIGTDCQTVVVNTEQNHTSEHASQFIELSAEQAVSAIWCLRASINETAIPDQHSIPDQIFDLAKNLKSSHYGSLIWGSDHCEPEFDVQADGLHALIRELNQHTRAIGIPYRRDANGLSAENVSTWSSGFPFAVNWNRESPRQYWLEYSDLTVSESDAWDFLISFDIGEIVIASQAHAGQGAFQMSLPVAELGVSETGDACRFDDVSITLKATEDTTAPTTIEILESIDESLQAADDNA